MNEESQLNFRNQILGLRVCVLELQDFQNSVSKAIINNQLYNDTCWVGFLGGGRSCSDSESVRRGDQLKTSFIL